MSYGSTVSPSELDLIRSYTSKEEQSVTNTEDRASNSSDTTDASSILLERLREKLEQKARLLKAVETRGKERPIPISSVRKSGGITQQQQNSGSKREISRSIPSRSLMAPTTSFQLKTISRESIIK